MEAMLNRLVAGDDQYDIGDLVDQLADSVMPPIVPSWASVVPELNRGEGGFSDFRDREIVPRTLQGLPKAQQYTENTNLLSREIGKRMGISPVKSDYFIQSGMGAGACRVVELAVDPIIGKATGQEPLGETAMESLARKNLFHAGDRRGEIVNRFYERLNELRGEGAEQRVKNFPSQKKQR